MAGTNVHEQARALLDTASTAHGGRAAALLVGGPGSTMTQTVLALRGGASLAEHENPGEASLLVLSGTVRLHVPSQSWQGEPGDLLEIPRERHGLDALTDAVVVLTAVKLADAGPAVQD